MPVQDAFITLGLAAVLGLLVGLQREHVAEPLAGLRTFTLITVLGALAGILAHTLGAWIVAAGFIALAMVTFIGEFVNARQPAEASSRHTGITTEVAALLMYLLGAYIPHGHREVSVVIGGAVAVLLYAKPMLHGFVRRLGDADMRAMMQFVLITLVILPILPDEPYGPFDVLNPQQIWWFVVLVVGISFGSYIALKLFGEGAGAVLSGLLGGMISSTATTVSYSRRAAGEKRHAPVAALVIMLASTVVYVRVLVEVAVVAPQTLPRIAPPVLVLLLTAIGLSVAVWIRNRSLQTKVPEQKNPTELKSAIVFGAMYAIVLFAVAAAKHYFDEAGIYIVAGISGLTDMDAITLSTSRMASQSDLSADTAWRAIVVATIANLVFKAGIAGALGGRVLFARLAVLFGINILVALALLVLWPENWMPFGAWSLSNPEPAG